jgi:two-component system CheB/CheR fusion protein
VPARNPAAACHRTAGAGFRRSGRAPTAAGASSAARRAHYPCQHARKANRSGDDFPHPFISVVIEEVQTEVKPQKSYISSNADSSEQILALERELTETRENLQAVIEEMETVNEELQSSNEEMISTNEELQSTNEELQSLNEELHTVSAEHQLKIKELFELNDDLNNYFNNSDIGQILVDGKMIIRKFSPSSKQIINLIDGDIGRPLNDITTNLVDIDLSKEVTKVIQNLTPIEREVQTVERKYCLMRISPFMRRDKTADGVVINFIDISQSKNLASIIEGIFESSTNGITAKRAVRDEKNRIIDFEYVVANVAAEKMFQVEHQSLVGKRLLQLFSEERRGYFKTLAKVVETGIPAKIEFFDDKAGRWYETTIVKMLDGVVTTHSDITERKSSADLIEKSYEELKEASAKLSETNSQLERSNFDLMQFASVASHDLKEPLRKIQAFGNILHAKIKDRLSESELSYFSKIISASNRMQALIDDVLTLSKLSNNSVKEKIDLNRVIKQIIDDLEITILEKNAVITTDTLPIVEAVPGQMHQVFQNLISNALKFTNKRKPVIKISQKPVSTKHFDLFGIPENGYVYIQVTDNGIGFEDEYREKIFGIFQRLHGRNYEGTGIGLAIARKILENHGGFIFANGSLNKGAIFHIFIPTHSNDEMAVKHNHNAEMVL